MGHPVLYVGHPDLYVWHPVLYIGHPVLYVGHPVSLSKSFRICFEWKKRLKTLKANHVTSCLIYDIIIDKKILKCVLPPIAMYLKD